MDRDRWQRVKTIYQQASDLPAGERQAFVQHACDGDADLEAEILRLLGMADTSGESLDNIVGAASQSLHLPSIKDQRVGPYRLLDVIGQGGMGQVYLAERADDEFEQRVAIKMVNWLGATPELTERFQLERQILATLEHPNIARLLDGGRTDTGVPYLVMEFVAGESILNYARSQELSLDQRLDLFLAICDAVQYAHRKLVVHRDIKPSNVLVTATGTPKLLDFGIAKFLDTVGEQPVTRADARVMTPEYASPEQLLGEPVTTSTDVYGLGMMLYQLLTDAMPFDLGSRTSPEIRDMVCNTEPTLPSRAASAIGRTERAMRLSGDLDNIIMMALRKDPARRYGTVRELAEDIRNYRADLPVRARGDSWGYRSSKFLRRHRIAVGAAIVSVAVLSLLIGFHTLRLAEERNAAQLEAARAEEVADFLTQLFAEANPRNNLGNAMSARQMLDAGANRIIDGLTAQPELQAALMVTMGKSYLEMRENKAAQEYLDRAVASAEAALGREHPDVLELKYLLGITHTELGNPDVARPIHEANHEIQSRLHGATSLEAAVETRQLAVVAYRLGEHESAEEKFQEAIAALRGLGPAGTDELAAALLDYGSLLRWLDRGEEEEPLLLEALALREQKYGNGHPDYAAVVNNLGNHYFRRGEIGTAATYWEEHVRLQRRLVGEDGVPYGNALANYSTLQLAQGNAEAALESLDTALAIYAKGYGNDSVPYAYALENKANILMQLQRYDEAGPLYVEVLGIIGERLGEDHKEYAFTQSNYGGMLLEAGRFAEGEMQLRSAVKTFSTAMSPDYSRTMLAQTKLAQCLWPQGNLDEALEVALAAEETARQIFTVPHAKLGQALRVLATVHRERGEYVAADALYREAIGVYEQTEEQPLVWATRTEVLYAGSLAAQGNRDLARKMLLARDKMLTATGEDYGESRREIATALAKIDDTEIVPAIGQ